ncbi:hypothetical protein IJI76_02925 [Candidatus Saccharibacteria bacterium]|nr:hypothetical protein [Candidatus Saccharibacteria bacterium]
MGEFRQDYGRRLEKRLSLNYNLGMIKIDNDFLNEVGLSEMAEERKADFIAQTQAELETRVGEKMSSGMSVEQLREFDGIMHNDRNTMIRVLSQIGDYREDELYQKLLKRHEVSEGNLEILGEYLSVKWVQLNRPDYATVTKSVVEELKNEIINAREEILAAN